MVQRNPSEVKAFLLEQRKEYGLMIKVEKNQCAKNEHLKVWEEWRSEAKCAFEDLYDEGFFKELDEPMCNVADNALAPANVELQKYDNILFQDELEFKPVLLDAYLGIDES